MIRPHPGDFDSISLKLKEMNASENVIVSSQSLFEDIFICDAVVTTISSIGIDATIFEKPIFLVDISGQIYESLGGIHKYMIDNDVAKLVSLNDLTEIFELLTENLIWTPNHSKQKNFMNSFFNYGEKINLLNLIYQENKNED